MIGSLSTCLIALSLLGVVLPGSEEKGEIGSDRGERCVFGPDCLTSLFSPS